MAFATITFLTTILYSFGVFFFHPEILDTKVILKLKKKWNLNYLNIKFKLIFKLINKRLNKKMN